MGGLVKLGRKELSLASAPYLVAEVGVGRRFLTCSLCVVQRQLVGA
jgi:hypothetical protein